MAALSRSEELPRTKSSGKLPSWPRRSVDGVTQVRNHLTFGLSERKLITPTFGWYGSKRASLRKITEFFTNAIL